METKFKLIETEDYILAVSDEDASNSCIYFTGDPTGIFRTGIKYKNEAGDYFYQDAITGMSNTYLAKISKKIIGYQPKGNAPELDLPLLPDIVVEDDVEKLGKQAYKKHSVKDDSFSLLEQIQRSGGFLVGFKEAYKAATKTYSEEDLRKAFEAGRKLTQDGFEEEDWKDYEEFIQSLKQPKPKWFVAEMEEECGYGANGYYSNIVLKTTTINNKTYLEGTYLN
jgi:hypothetical protein